MRFVIMLVAAFAAICGANLQSEFLDFYRLKTDPFALNAAEMADEHFLAGTKVILQSVWSLLSQDSVIIFGRRGSGKTFIRRVRELDLSKSEPDTLVAYLTDPVWMTSRLSAFVDSQDGSLFSSRKSFADWDSRHFCDLILTRVLPQLVSRYLQHKPRLGHTEPLSPEQLRQLYMLAVLYMHTGDADEDAMLSQLRAVISPGKYPQTMVAQGLLSGSEWPWVTSLMHDIRVVPNSPGRRQRLEDAIALQDPAMTADAFRVFDLGRRGVERVQGIDNLVKSLGWRNKMLVLLDALDETDQFSFSSKDADSNVERLTNFAQGFMQHSFLSQVRFLAFLPCPKSWFSREVLIDQARCDKRACVELEWDYGSLAVMLKNVWKYNARADQPANKNLSSLFGVDPVAIPEFVSMERRCTPRQVLAAVRAACVAAVDAFNRLPDGSPEKAAFQFRASVPEFKRVIAIECPLQSAAPSAGLLLVSLLSMALVGLVSFGLFRRGMRASPA